MRFMERRNNNIIENKGIEAYSVENDELVKEIEDKYYECKQGMLDLHTEWISNMQFVAGNQYEYHDEDYNTHETKRLYEYEEREVRNKIRTYKNSYVARITLNKPYPFSKPITLKEEDVRSAKVTNAVIEDLWEKKKVPKLINRIGEFLGTLGCAFIKVGWDKQAGDKIFSFVDTMKENIQNNPMFSDEYKQVLMNKILKKEDVYQGDVFMKVLSPFEIYVSNPLTFDMDEQRYIIHARVYDRELLKMAYGLSDEDLPEEEASTITMQTDTISSGLGYYTRGYSYKNQRAQNSAIVKEYYERPSRYFPNGRFIISVGNRIVHYGDLPYEIGDDSKVEFPFIRLVATEEIGNFYGATPISDLKPIQKDYNAVRNRTREAHNRKSIRQTIVYENSIHEESEFDNTPGSLIVVKAGKPRPTTLDDGIQTTEFFKEMEMLDKEFMDISMIMPSQNNIPSQIRSAAQLSMVYENQDINLGIPIRNIAQGINEAFKMMIRLYKQFMHDNRFVKFQQSHEEHIEWNKEIINENIYIKNINALVKSPAQQQQAFTDLINLGLFHEQNPYGMENSIKMLEMFGLGHMSSEMAIPHKQHYDKAKRENRRVINGKPIIVGKYDNHAMHRKLHTDFIVSEDYEEYIYEIGQKYGIEVANKVEKQLSDHIDKHSEYISMQQAQMMAQMMMQQGKK